ncbi:exodeoxyribonuclease VII small subunit [Desulfovibrio piger]|uniref:exodeoxyribonuclease VII small subunit n=1 Tax=Desulfovibrio piger TaxID=901 RepID=UPI0025D67C80|nr:exodeoxyribonuclease VII small subunit [Desulfovibrio piger]
MKARASKKNLTFEERMARLQEIVETLENGQPSLEEGMALYREGMECSLQCRRQLEQARQQLTVWQDGQVRAFRPEESAEDPLQQSVEQR